MMRKQENEKKKAEIAECKEYEQINLPRMWSEDGTPTTYPANGYFVEVRGDMTAFWLQMLCPDENWKNLGTDGLGIYRWDVALERYEKINFYDDEILKTFIEKNRDSISGWL